MTNNDGWSSKWPSGAGWFDIPKTTPEAAAGVNADWLTHNSDATHEAAGLNKAWPKAPELKGIDFGIGERTVLTTIEKDELKHRIISRTELKPQGSNLVDDQQYLYFQCEGCNKILDPNTKSFRVLQEHRVNAGWKCVWNINGAGYKVYCAKCGEKV